MLRADRLASIGELTTKVAHELNNPLASILLYNSLLLEQPSPPDEQHRIAEAVLDQAERARRVVWSLLDYSRPEEPKVEMTTLAEVVAEALRLVQHAATVGYIQLVERHADEQAPVLVDRCELAQVFVNLALNAIQATPRGGMLRIETGVGPEGAYARFTDNGTGIAAGDLERIFEPFFTTKRRAEGTGLGLAVCRTLIAQHGGHISGESELGAGSTFTVWLPVAQVREVVGVG